MIAFLLQMSYFCCNSLLQMTAAKGFAANDFAANDHTPFERVYGHLQQPGFSGPPKFRSFAAKPFAATKIGHLQQNHLQQQK